jgi:uncharacterized repeat protein (TIGR01451 family)
VSRLVKTAILGLALLALAPIAQAAAAPQWDVKARWGDTVIAPGDTAAFVVVARNIGTSPSKGTVTLKDQLPAGLKITGFNPNTPWNCSGIGSSTATCQLAESVLSVSEALFFPGVFHWYARDRALIDVTCVEAAGCVEGERPNVAQVSSPGAVKVDGTPCGSGFPPVPCASDTDMVSFASGGTPFGTPFGITHGSYAADVFRGAYPDPTPERQAGTHPEELRIKFDFNLKHGTEVFGQQYTMPVGRVRTVEVTLPRGLYGNPEAAPKCKPFEFLAQGAVGDELLGANSTACPSDTQIGYLNLDLSDTEGAAGFGIFGPGSANRIAIYNMVPPKGVPADFGFHISGLVDAHIYPSLDASHGYSIKTTTPYINDLLPVRGADVTFWGVPGDPAHDKFRAFSTAQDKRQVYGAPASTPLRPFLDMPMDCGTENGPFLMRADDWRSPEAFTPIEESEAPLDVTGCDDRRIRFEPQVRLQPTSRAAGGPTGLDVHLEVPQRDQRVEDYTKLYAQNGNLHGIDTPPLKKVVVTFPEGMTLSPSATQGLSSCTPQEIGIGTNSPVRCPESSRYGALTLHTPILPEDEPMVGDIYVAQQGQNPFNNFLSLYFVIHDESRGLLVKLPGKIDLDPKTGQITATLDDLPQFPITDTQLTFKSGVRAALVNPETCGQKQIKAEFFSWADPDTPVTQTSSYDISQKGDGSPCVKSLAERPFRPDFSAGTVNPNAGGYSPFAFRLQRTDDDQEFSQLSTTLPPGLLANISKLSECSEAGIAQAQTPGRSGIAEQRSPSCPASSQLGNTEVGSGVGQVITYIPGKAYLAGPYHGAPLSLVVITPIVSGPYDLGVIAVRSAIHVNGERAQATISTDPFPQIYKGIPVRIRDIRVSADTPQTIINPTSCDPMAITAHLTGTGGDLASTLDDSAVDLANRFQAANCASLPFKPKLSFRLKGGTKRGQFPAFSALLRGREGDANIARSTVVLPASEYIEQGHIRTVCTRPQYAADQCPAGSIYGMAKAKSPLFDEVLEGQVYLRSNGGERLLPDLVVKLNGKITVTLAGFIDSLKSRVRNTFDVVPDAPVTYFSLQMRGGKQSLLVNHRDLCTAPSRASVQLTGQNGKTHNTRPKVAVDCAAGQGNRGQAKNKPGKRQGKSKPGRGAGR